MEITILNCVENIQIIEFIEKADLFNGETLF